MRTERLIRKKNKLADTDNTMVIAREGGWREVGGGKGGTNSDGRKRLRVVNTTQIRCTGDVLQNYTIETYTINQCHPNTFSKK